MRYALVGHFRYAAKTAAVILVLGDPTGLRFMVPRGGGWLARRPDPTSLPPWLSETSNAKLKYDEQLAAYVQKSKDKGYAPITFQDLVLDKKDLASRSTKIALHGFYKSIGKNEIVFRLII